MENGKSFGRLESRKPQPRASLNPNKDSSLQSPNSRAGWDDGQHVVQPAYFTDEKEHI